VKELKKALDHLKQLLSIMKECDLNAERSVQLCRAIDGNTACYRVPYQEKEEEEASVQLSLD
jgi:hypothetical protein